MRGLNAGGGANIFTILPSGHSHPSIFFFNQANSYPSFYRIVCYKYCSTVSSSTFLRHFCKQSYSPVPLIRMSRSLKFMNCCKFFQSKHGQPWPCKGGSWSLSMSDLFTKKPQNVMREENVLHYLQHNSIVQVF